MLFVKNSFAKKARVLMILSGLAFYGCGGGGADAPPVAEVTGNLKINGEAIEGATISFNPDAGGRPSNATTDAQGNYELEWSGDIKGAAIGTHTVVIQTERAAFTPEGEEGTAQEARLELLPPEYNSESTQKADVKDESNVINFDIDAKGYKPSPKKRQAPASDA